MNTMLASALATFCLFGQLSFSAAVKEALGPEAIDRAAAELGHRDFAVRHEAMLRLWETGLAAEPALRRAAASTDREVAFRANWVLDNFRHGLFADTPPEIARLISRFRDGNADVRRDVISQLQGRGAIETMLALLDSEPNESARGQLVAQALSEVEKIAPKLIEAGDYDRLKRLLKLGAMTDSVARYYVSFVVMRGEADDALRDLERQAETSPLSPKEMRLQAALYRAVGDLTAARAAAERSEDGETLRAVLFELGEWRELARLEEQQLPMLNGPALIEKLGYVAAYYQLAGDEAASRDALRRARESAPDAALSGFVAEALLITGNYDQGIAQFERTNSAASFRLLAAQAKYREAFDHIELPATETERDAWFATALADAASKDDQLKRQRFEVSLQAARALARLGLEAEARRRLAALADVARQDEDGHLSRLRSVISVASKSGLRDVALEHTAYALANTNNLYALGSAYPEHSSAATIWLEFFRAAHPTENDAANLKRVDQLLFRVEPKATEEELSRIVETVVRDAPSMDKVKGAALLFQAGEAMLGHRREEDAIKLLRLAAENSADAALKLGDLAARKEAFSEAADWYAQTWKLDPSRPIAVFLQGKMLERMERADDGKRLVNLASLYPLSAPSRRSYAEAMQERGYKDEAIVQWRLLVNTGDLTDWHTNDAAKQMGNLTSGRDAKAASDGWQRLLLSALQVQSSFVEVEGYLQLPHVIHKVRARALLAEGKHDEAVAELQKSVDALPGSIKLAEDLFEKFDAAGLKMKIDPMFDSMYALYERLCEDFPEVATHHNNLAWLAARSGRRLDDARLHAERAVALAPESMAYLDTLAEVHFRLGDAPRAIELAEKCLAAEPENAHYVRQVKRFRGEAVEAEEPTEP